MTHKESNQQRSVEAFLARKAEFDALIADLQQASADHFGAEPDAVLWGKASWLNDVTRRLRDIADQHHAAANTRPNVPFASLLRGLQPFSVSLSPSPALPLRLLLPGRELWHRPHRKPQLWMPSYKGDLRLRAARLKRITPSTHITVATACRLLAEQFV